MAAVARARTRATVEHRSASRQLTRLRGPLSMCPPLGPCPSGTPDLGGDGPPQGAAAGPSDVVLDVEAKPGEDRLSGPGVLRSARFLELQHVIVGLADCEVF